MSESLNHSFNPVFLNRGRDRRGGANCFQEKTETRHYLGTGCILLRFTFHVEYTWKIPLGLEENPLCLKKKKTKKTRSSSAFSCRWGEADLISLPFMQLSVQTRFRTSVISSGTDFGKKFMDKFITRTKRSCDDDAWSAPAPKKCKTRKYDISYLQFGFTVAGTDAEPLPQCVICTDLLAMIAWSHASWSAILETKHPTHSKNKTLRFFSN